MKLFHFSFKTMLKTSAIASLIFLMNCKDDTNAPTTYWYAPQNGYILEEQKDRYTLYGTSASGCVLIDNDVSPRNYSGIQLTKENGGLIASSELLTGHIAFDELLTTEEFCDVDNPIMTNDPVTNFNYFWNIFNDYYAFFELRNVNWNEYREPINSVNEDNLYDILEAMILPLKDGHVSISNESVNIRSDKENLLQQINMHLDNDIKTREELIEIATDRISFINTRYLNDQTDGDSNGNMVWGLLSADIGYVNIISMQDYAASYDQEISVVDELMGRLTQAIQQHELQKLVIDLRFNTGGYDGVALEIASRFVSQSGPVFTKKSRLEDNFTHEQIIELSPNEGFQFNGDVVLLTSPLTASAAEVFTLCLKDLSNLTIVGQNTSGIFSDILTHRLPNGTFVNLSNQVYADPSGKVYEAIGISPDKDHEIPFLSSDDFNNNVDSGIEWAMELLK
ncbi:S41 family peptidase [Ekhidna sp.]